MTFTIGILTAIGWMAFVGLTFLVPTLESKWKDVGAPLNSFQKILLSTGHWMMLNWIPVIALLGILTAVWLVLLARQRSPSG